MGRNSMGISKTLVVIVIAAIVIVASGVGAYWWFFLREEGFTGEPITIGVICNEFVQGQGMREASIMAAEDINDAGGILGRKVVLKFGDEGTEASKGVAEITRLITVEGVDFIIGGFRTEIVYPMREVAMDYKKIFIITGASTTELLNCEGSRSVKVPCDQCVRCDYTRYKYLFRVMPPNSTLLFTGTLLPYLQLHLIPEVLGGTEESPVRVAAVVENLAWADLVAYVYDVAFQKGFGSAAEKVRDAWRPSHNEKNFEGILNAIEDYDTDLIMHVFSGESGLSYVKQWGEMQIQAVTVGINVLSQNSEMWDDTDGYCEYEAFLSSAPRVNVTDQLIPWWDRYVEKWGHDPVYTAQGQYDAFYALKDGIEAAETIDSDAVVAAMEEQQERDTLTGKSKFTQYHDVFIMDAYPMTEHKDWATPLIVQWRDGQREVVFPSERSYTTEFEIPPWITP